MVARMNATRASSTMPPAPLPALTWLRVGLLAAAIAIGLVPLYRFAGSMIWFDQYLGDYNVFWGIARAPLDWIYDRYHFPYPPTALLLVRPFGMVDFWPSLVAWGAAGALAITLGARRLMSANAVAIGFASCAAFGVLLGGQVSLFIGALVMAGVGAKHPRWRGALLAAAAVIKPQSLLAAPVALIAERNWRAIGWAIATACALLVVSALLFGPAAWPAWLNALRTFPSFLTSSGVDRTDVGIYGLAVGFGLPGWTFLAGVPLGVAASWLVFGDKHSSPVDRYAAFACSTILMSPYTLSYDLAGLSFACVAMLLDEKRSPLIWLAAAMIVTTVFANVGIVLMALLLGREALQRRKAA